VGGVPYGNYNVSYEDLSRWFNWEGGYLIRFDSRYMVSRLYGNMNVLMVSVLVFSTTRNKGYNSTMKMFG
jgi:hypothetical protein